MSQKSLHVSDKLRTTWQKHISSRRKLYGRTLPAKVAIQLIMWWLRTGGVAAQTGGCSRPQYVRRPYWGLTWTLLGPTWTFTGVPPGIRVTYRVTWLRPYWGLTWMGVRWLPGVPLVRLCRCSYQRQWFFHVAPAMQVLHSSACRRPWQ